eukprot:3844805-Pleurochrysis_carterae.AAC.1
MLWPPSGLSCAAAACGACCEVLPAAVEVETGSAAPNADHRAISSEIGSNIIPLKSTLSHYHSSSLASAAAAVNLANSGSKRRWLIANL